MNTELLSIIITAVVTIVTSGVIAAIIYRRQNKRIKTAEAVVSELQAAQQFSTTVNEMSNTIAMLNKTIDGKTARIREVEDSKMHTERENTRIAEENGELKKELAEKRCHLLDCQFREPPTDRSRKAKALADSANTAGDMATGKKTARNTKTAKTTPKTKKNEDTEKG